MDRESTSGLAQQAYASLLGQIQSCAYLPGQPISEKRIADETGFGRTPVREALLMLKQEGLVEVYPRKGMKVAAVTEASVQEMYQARRLLEPTIAEQHVSAYSKEELFEFRRRFEATGPETGEAHYRVDVEFHGFLVAVTRNRLLIETHQVIMRQQFRLAMYATILGTSTPEDNLPQHLAIIDALLRENPVEVRDALVYHLNHSLVSSLRSVERAARNRSS